MDYCMNRVYEEEEKNGKPYFDNAHAADFSWNLNLKEMLPPIVFGNLCVRRCLVKKLENNKYRPWTIIAYLTGCLNVLRTSS